MMNHLLKIKPVTTLSNVEQIFRHYARKRTIICENPKFNGVKPGITNKNTPKKRNNLNTKGCSQFTQGIVTKDSSNQVESSEIICDSQKLKVIDSAECNPPYQTTKESTLTHGLVRGQPFKARPNDTIESLYDLEEKEGVEKC